MGFQKLKNAATFSLSVGTAFLLVGVYYFLSANTGTMTEKIGLVLTIYASVFLGVGFTAWITLKNNH